MAASDFYTVWVFECFHNHQTLMNSAVIKLPAINFSKLYTGKALKTSRTLTATGKRDSINYNLYCYEE